MCCRNETSQYLSNSSTLKNHTYIVCSKGTSNSMPVFDNNCFHFVVFFYCRWQYLLLKYNFLLESVLNGNLRPSYEQRYISNVNVKID